MPKNNALSNGILNLIFNATTIANLANNATTAPLTSLYVALHTADPTVTGTQTSNEVTTGQYAGYARVAVSRATGAGGWNASSSQSTSPASAIQFPAGTGGTGATITYFSIGSLTSGAGVIYYSGTVTPNIVVGNGVTPILSTATTITEA
jgi:hypothetical protein